MQRYPYQAEKLTAARSCLMRPYVPDEAHSIYCALAACDLAFRGLVESALTEAARKRVATIKQMLDTTGVRMRPGESALMAKARMLSPEQKSALRESVNVLAEWFKDGGVAPRWRPLTDGAPA